MRIARLQHLRQVEKEVSPQLCVSVLFTDVPSTLKALAKAGHLAVGLKASIDVIAPVVVPYPLPVGETPVNEKHLVRRLRTIACGMSVPTRINLVYCRDRSDAIRSLLKPDTVLVMAWKKRLLFDRTLRLANELRRDGYHVITVDETRGA